MTSDWDDLHKSTLPTVVRDVPLGFCWYCRRRIDVAREAWRPWPCETVVHPDCERIWSDGPAVPIGHRRDYETEDDFGGYFEELEEAVHVLHPSRRPQFPTEPRLQARLDAEVEARYQWAVRELLGSGNPWRQPGEDNETYLRRIIFADKDEDDDDEET